MFTEEAHKVTTKTISCVWILREDTAPTADARTGHTLAGCPGAAFSVPCAVSLPRLPPRRAELNALDWVCVSSAPAPGGAAAPGGLACDVAAGFVEASLPRWPEV